MSLRSTGEAIQQNVSDRMLKIMNLSDFFGSPRPRLAMTFGRNLLFESKKTDKIYSQAVLESSSGD